MKRALSGVCLVLFAASWVSAQELVLSPSPPVVQRMTYYGPTAVVAPTTTYYAPAPVTTYYAPAPVPVTTYYAPAPVTTYYAPAPVPVTSYYAPAAVPVTTYYAPGAVPVTSYYAPAVVAPYGVVRAKAYYPGEPVRNFLKAVTW